MNKKLRHLTIIKRDDGTNYFDDLLEMIHLPLVHVSELADTPPPRYFIRHDVDHDIDTALLMAEAEAERGYKATYFLLTPGSYGEKSNYYGSIEDGVLSHKPDLIEKCKRFIDLGHEIGLHNDIISLAIKLKRNPGDILREETQYFASSGVPLVGTASHGSPLARKLEYTNFEIFSDCVRKKSEPNHVGRTITDDGWTVKLHSLRLADYGFRYEVYFVKRDADIADSGSRWIAELMQNQPTGILKPPLTKGEFRERIATFLAQPEVRSLQLLIHPCHWDVFSASGEKLSVIVRSRPDNTATRIKSALKSAASQVGTLKKPALPIHGDGEVKK